ncbi:cryptochrome/photolyase family protein [Paracoccus benzoatiresistens]|uniref:Deoxyribodipyrimidine photo-lyase n=1 Tax=Paracoccus benzoatiresistens TaxID=2997341 RepID=A0ABT4J2H3_9RHOB|nr:deoxyribodipyrimidine photo-lyase [Paracoccus sp. EF6]MCZ0960608.1 deoxyribodipyrimidine photo-lyase [Paracoccus sp. EF6]
MTVICWFRRVLRLDDHPALVAAAKDGPVIPLVILDPAEARAHPASAQRQAMALQGLADGLQAQGSRLIVRRGDPATVLAQMIHETGAVAVHGSEGLPFAGDHGLRAAVESAGARLHLHPLADLVPRGSVLTKGGTRFKVFTPFWRALRQTDIAAPLPMPRLSLPTTWPASDAPDWPEARAAMNRGWPVVARHVQAGEAAAHDRLDAFLERITARYAEDRDRPALGDATSGLSDALAVGEISARRIWHRAMNAQDHGRGGLEDFLRELAWREFARDLFHEAPGMDRACWRKEWNDFSWQGDNADAEAWRRGRTGISMVDAGMREMFATGRMHNRVRMITASFLVKHLMIDWRVGLDRFARCLTDWDAASNAMNWQWVAGCGPDASPFFRVFNPETQGSKFDPRRLYRDHWLKEEGARDFARAAPRSWSFDPKDRPAVLVDLDRGRQRALAAYRGFARKEAAAR